MNFTFVLFALLFADVIGFKDSNAVKNHEEKEKQDVTMHSHGNDNDDDIINDVTTGEDDSSYDLLGEEGKPGWFEKLTEIGKKQLKEKAKEKSKPQGSQRRSDASEKKKTEFPKEAEKKLTDALNDVGSKADGAKSGLAAIKAKWQNLDGDVRDDITEALQSSASLFQPFANAEKNPLGAMKATIDVVASFSAVAGPGGQLASVALTFVSGFLSLFGVGDSGGNSVDIGKVVRKEIDAALKKYHDQVLKEEVAGTIHSFTISKAYVDSLSRRGKMLTEHQALSLKANVPLWKGLKMLGKLKLKISELLQENKRNTAKKLLEYIELYAKVAMLKDMILMQSITLLPDEANRNAMFAAQKALRNSQRNLLKFLFNAHVKSKIAVAYYDPDNSPVTDKYLSVLLKVPNYDRSLAGVWCISEVFRGWGPVKRYGLVYSKRYRALITRGHWYLAGYSGDYGSCSWKLVPHGNNLYTIGNTARVGRDRSCCEYVSHDTLDSNSMRVTLEDEAEFWEITGGKKKRIRSKWGCDTKNKFCDLEPYLQSHRIKRPLSYVPDFPTYVLELRPGRRSGYSWEFTKRRRSS